MTNTSWAGSTLTWNIAKLDDSLRKMTYVVDACDCASVGDIVETLASVSYTDDDNSPATHPTLPTSIAFDVVDPSETCGVLSVTVGERCCETITRTLSFPWFQCGMTYNIRELAVQNGGCVHCIRFALDTNNPDLFPGHDMWDCFKKPSAALVVTCN